jgi:hypothetical protein
VNLLAGLALTAVLTVTTPGVSITPGDAHLTVGDSMTLTTTITNDGDQPLTGRIAHLNVLSVDPGTYVDPEDWSDQRTQYLPTIPAHGSSTQQWSVQAVNHGSFLLYVALTDPTGSGPVVASPAVHLTVTTHATLDPGGSLVAVIGIPTALGGLLLAQQLARRRRR